MKFPLAAGNEITNPILPMGIINDTDTYAIENSNVAEVVDQWTYDEDGYKDQRIVTIKGKKGQEGKETNLVITTEVGETLKIPVKVTQGSIVNPPVVAPTEPTKPENPKPEAPKPTPTQPTTAATTKSCQDHSHSTIKQTFRRKESKINSQYFQQCKQ